MRDWYTNQNGERVEVAKMVDAHLINACMKYKKRLAELRDFLKRNEGKPTIVTLQNYEQELAMTYKLLRDEYDRRGIV